MKTNVFNVFALLCMGVMTLSAVGCGMIQICIERPKDIANAPKYVDQHPLTAEKLKHILLDDTTHYKVVVFYSHCCGPCQEQLRYTYSKLWNADTAHVRWYFVLDDCSSLKYNNTKYLKRYGIETPYMYYLRDDDPRFCVDAEDRFLNIAQYIFGGEQDIEDVINGIPNTFVVNPQGKLKTEYRRYADGNVVVGNYDCLYELLYKEVYPKIVPLDVPLRVQDLDFDRRDTADYTAYGKFTGKPKVCTPDGCY